MTKFAIGNLIGVLTLLVPCIMLFDGKLAPAMWQLTSLFWIVFWSAKCLKDEKK